jgi:hypothetical protein
VSAVVFVVVQVVQTATVSQLRAHLLVPYSPRLLDWSAMETILDNRYVQY